MKERKKEDKKEMVKEEKENQKRKKKGNYGEIKKRNKNTLEENKVEIKVGETEEEREYEDNQEG